MHATSRRQQRRRQVLNAPKFYMPVKLERLPRLCYPETQCTGESAQPTMYDPAVRTGLGIVRQQPTDPWPLTATQLASS